jgi:hypothetical protein
MRFQHNAFEDWVDAELDIDGSPGLNSRCTPLGY